MTRRPPGAAAGGHERRQRELETTLRPVVQDAGFDLEALTLSQAGRRSVLRVIVDSDAGVNLDDIAAISRRVSEQLDAGDDGFGASPYTLEVTSPGVDRPLTEVRHWRRAIGRLVQWQHNGRSTTGRVAAVDGDSVTIRLDGRDEQFSRETISPARVQVEFNKSESGKEHP
ncbi:ribosome maturation factor RimP [Cumulibacter soli]|uniref:ribosome maturation factor RimP n=1 Tax=Cumulibacter soli TaxID=2546344 RepID=UPI0010676ABB|nr:ribosome maturation factor RimP [Cumulibacter soli]